MANKIQLKRSTIAGRIPTTSDLDIGELALNHSDNALYAVTTVANAVTTVTQLNGPQNVTLTGDVSASANTAGNITTTLSSTGVTAGVYGSSANIPVITVDGKGRITNASNVSVTIPPAFTGNLGSNYLYATENNSAYSGAANVYIKSPSTTIDYSSLGSIFASNSRESVMTTMEGNISVASAGFTSGPGSRGYKIGSKHLFQPTATTDWNARDGVVGQARELNVLNAGHSLTPSGTAAVGPILGSSDLATMAGYGYAYRITGALNGAVQVVNGGTSNVAIANGHYSSIQNFALDGSSGTIDFGSSYLATVYEGSYNGDGNTYITNWAGLKVDPGQDGGSSGNMYSVYSDNAAVSMLHAGAINSSSTITAPAFAGNITLKGGSISDSVNKRVKFQAYPISATINPYPDTGVAPAIDAIPTYTSGVLIPSTWNTTTSAFQSNISLASKGGNFATTTGGFFLSQYTANSGMTHEDRTRALVAMNEVYLNGNNWGNSNNPRKPTNVGAHVGVTTMGTGNTGNSIGLFNFVGMESDTGHANNAQFMTGTQTNFNSPTTGGSSTVNNFRLLTGTILDNEGSGNNCTITNAIGLHLPSGWNNQLPVTNSYAILSDDGRSGIKIQGVIETTANITTTTDMVARDVYAKNITPVTTKTANYTVATTDYIIAANGAITVTLPSATTAGNGRTFRVKRISNSGPVLVNATAGTIDGNTTIEINAQWASITVVSDGSNWLII